MEAIIANTAGSSRNFISVSPRRNGQALPTLSGISDGKTIASNQPSETMARFFVLAKSVPPTPPEMIDWYAGSISVNLTSLADPRFLPRPGDVFRSMNFIAPGLQPNQTKPAAPVKTKDDPVRVIEAFRNNVAMSQTGRH